MKTEVVTVRCGGDGPMLPVVFRDGVADKDTSYSEDVTFRIIHNENNEISPCGAYQHALTHTKANYLVYLHDDLEIYDLDWLDRLHKVLSFPKVCAAGFGGAKQLGASGMYGKPFRIESMARFGYGDNQTNWQVHGSHQPGSRRVAVLDAYCMAVKVDWLRSRGGWPTAILTHHCLDTWLACEIARDNKTIIQEGVHCLHKGGGTSTKHEYLGARWLIGGNVNIDHEAPHKWLYNEYRDVLPISV